MIDSNKCHSKFRNFTDFDHAVLVVGFGKSDIFGGNYFVIKNSFSDKWGSKGYAKISADVSMDDKGVCGILANLYQPEYIKKIDYGSK